MVIVVAIIAILGGQGAVIGVGVGGGGVVVRRASG